MLAMKASDLAFSLPIYRAFLEVQTLVVRDLPLSDAYFRFKPPVFPIKA